MIAVNYQLQDFLKLTRYAHIYNEKSHYPPAVISAPTLTFRNPYCTTFCKKTMLILQSAFRVQ